LRRVPSEPLLTRAIARWEASRAARSSASCIKMAVGNGWLTDDLKETPFALKGHFPVDFPRESRCRVPLRAKD
jgi:hypothetical protein